MKKRTLILSSLIGLILFACGGGGGGGGGGGTDTGDTTFNALEYLNKDMTKTYTYQVSEYAAGSDTPTTTNSWVYNYGQTASIPSAYGYTGSIEGPYIVEELEIDGTLVARTFKGSDGTSIISDNSSIYTMNVPEHYSSSGNIPSEMTLGTQYGMTSTADLLNSNPGQGTVGEKLGTRTESYTIRIVSEENVTVTAGTYLAIKTQETTAVTITTSGGTKTLNTTSSSWWGKGIGPVKSVANTVVVAPDGTTTTSVTTELTTVE